MGITVRQVMKYLSEYPDEAKLGVMVVDTKNRKKYQIKAGNWLDMFSYPVLVLDVGEAHDMDEVEKQVACECEEPEILELTKDLVHYKCKNSPAVVVSATEVIEETGCAQVAWLTNKEENSSSTHAKVMCMTPSVAICEKLSFAYLDRFGEYIRTCTEKEIQDIDNAMLATFGIERQNDNADCEEIRTLKKELEEKQREIEEMKVSAREKETEEKEPDDQMEEREEETGWKKQMYNKFIKGAGR